MATLRNVSDFKFFNKLLSSSGNKNIRNSLKNRGCLEYIPYMVFMLIIYTSMVSDADVIRFIAKLDSNSKVSSRQP